MLNSGGRCVSIDDRGRISGGGRIYIVFLAWPLALPLLLAAVSLSRAWKVFAIFRTLLTSRTDSPLANIFWILGGLLWLAGPRLTAGENHPDEVHEEVVSPEVQEFGS
jgi:hypothetical protein